MNDLVSDGYSGKNVTPLDPHSTEPECVRSSGSLQSWERADYGDAAYTVSRVSAGIFHNGLLSLCEHCPNVVDLLSHQLANPPKYTSLLPKENELERMRNRKIQKEQEVQLNKMAMREKNN